MKIVAITGRSGSGKSTVRNYYASLGYPALDADAAAHEITQPGTAPLRALVETFGEDILNEDGTLRRGLLAERAFSSPERTQLLMDITHPAIIELLMQGVKQAEKSGKPFVFVDGAAIIGDAFEPYCDVFIVVTAPERDAVSRIVLRDGVSKEAAHQRLGAQTSEKILCDAADYIIHNDSTTEKLQQQADEVLRRLLEMEAHEH